MDTVDVAIIGGGAAGMMAAISVKKHHPEKSVVLLDRTFELGRKLLIAGSGRGNLTNIHIQQSPETYIHGSNSLVEQIFSQFGYQQIVDFFSDMGIALYEEQKTEKGKMFPVIDHAKTVRDMIVDELEKLHVEVKTDTEVQSMKRMNDSWSIQTKSGDIQATDIILSCGGMTYPSLGSNGSGYDLAKSVGHTIIEPIPTAVPLVSKNMLSHLLQGEKLVMQVTLENGVSVKGDVLFTQYGVSGSAIFDVSRFVTLLLHREHKKEVMLHLSFFPSKTIDEITHLLEMRWKNHSDQLVWKSLRGLLTAKTAAAVCVVSEVPKEQTVGQITDVEKNRLVQTLFSYTVLVTDTRGWNEAEFTSGGVSIDEIDERTLASKKVPHLYMAGELLDVDGDIGGYNLSWAWASGWVAGGLNAWVV